MASRPTYFLALFVAGVGLSWGMEDTSPNIVPQGTKACGLLHVTAKLTATSAKFTAATAAAASLDSDNEKITTTVDLDSIGEPDDEDAIDAPLLQESSSIRKGAASSGHYCHQPHCMREGCDARPRAANCCTEHMFQALVAVTDWLDQHNHNYILTGGTLLGAVRNKSIIAWTPDVDIIIPDHQAEEDLKAQKDIPYTFFFDYLLRGCSNVAGAEKRVWTGSVGSPIEKDTGVVYWYMDLYTKSFTLGAMCRGQVCLDSNSDRKVEVDGRYFRAPDDPHGCLKDMYGADYMTPNMTLPADTAKLIDADIAKL